MLLHDNVRFFAQRVHFLHGTDLEGKVNATVALVLNLKHFCEVAIAKLLYHFEVIELQRVLVGFNEVGDLLGCELWLGLSLTLLFLFARLLVLRPVGSLAVNTAVG